MQAVSTDFVNAIKSGVMAPKPGCLISWKKNIDEDVKFVTLNQSYLGSFDKLKGSSNTITFYDKYDYQDETAYLSNFRVTRKVSNRPWGVIMATAEIELNNTSRRFMPDYDSDIGAYVGLPERPVKLSIGFNGEFIKLFTGYTNRPDSQLVKRITKITAYDAMTYLSGVKSNLGAFVNTPMNEIIEALLIEQGFSSDQFVIEKSLQLSIGYYMPKDKYVTDIFKEFCEAEAYLLFADEDGIIRGWNRLHLLGDRTAVWTFNYSNMADIKWSSSPVINCAKYTAKPFRPAAWNRIWAMTQASDSTLMPAGQSIDIFAEFRDDMADFPAISVDAPVYIDDDAGSSTYTTNRSLNGDGETGASNITLSSVYNFGSKYRMTFTNSGDFPVYITGIQLFGVPAKVVALSGVTQEAASSIGKYGINPDNDREVYKINNDLIQDVATANTMAWLLVNTYSDPLSKLDVDNFVVPHLQLGDPVNAYIADTNQTKYCNIMGMELFFGVNADLKQKMYIEERKQHTYLVLDNSQIDGSAGLAL